jgi:hypothetical protein
VDALQTLVRSVDADCFEAEKDHELSASGIARHRTEVCEQAMAKLVNFMPFETAEKAFSNTSAGPFLAQVGGRQGPTPVLSHASDLTQVAVV